MLRVLSSLFTALFVLLWAHSAYALTIDAVRFGVHPDKARVVLDLSADTPFKAFALSDPYRIVIDASQFEWRADPIYQAETAGVRGVRHGVLKPGTSRIVLEMQSAVAIRNAFIIPADGGEPFRLVIDFTTTDAAGLEAALGQSFGTLGDTGATPRTAHLSAPVPPPAKPQKPADVYKPLIVIDPGHGGVDPGAIGANNVFEKSVTLALGLGLKKRLEATGRYRVKMTREDDRFIKLADRVKFARMQQPDLFISLHADSINKSDVRGVSFYTLSDTASDAQTERLAARENRADLIAGIDLTVEDDEVANILVDLAMRDTMNQSRFFANALVSSFETGQIQLLVRPHRYAGFAVLKAADIPSVLVEAGFMSNKSEANLLNTAAHREKLAGALLKGIERYFEQVAKNSRI